MATILLGAVGAAVGAGFGGTVLGLSGAVIGRAVGATLGRVIDQRILGAGSDPVEVGRTERLRLMGASEGVGLPQVWGRVRVAGQVIWATRFREEVTREGGGKGSPRPRVERFSYSVSLAVALCEGTIAGIGRIWADGMEIDPATLNLRVYRGGEDQLPDPRIAAVEGATEAPAYRGIAYVLIEDLALEPFGNRVPQFAFEVIRPAQADGGVGAMAEAVRAVALMPGTGEYALATSRVHFADGFGGGWSANVNTATGRADMAVSLDQLRRELPRVGSAAVIVSWFGDDLRCGSCTMKPKIESRARDGVGMPWRAGGIVRAQADEVAQLDGRPIYGGTPADGAVIEAIQALRSGGQEAMFYPFLLMEQLAGNGLPDPWSDGAEQPVLPWRGRITTSAAPGRTATPDRTAAAEAEVAAFFGTVQPHHFAVSGGVVNYSGPPGDWGYRRFILHYAHLCVAAGGVDAFCIGSEMRGLTQVRGAGDSFPAVAAFRILMAEVRAILGPATKISYAADWTEYFGYHADGNVYFHLDPLWSDTNCDFVGIDNYMPLSDWRDGEGHADAGAGSALDLDYLAANVAGGEYFDWYYDGPEGVAAQRRLPIEDGEHGEPWVFRIKDLAGWWANPHHERIGGVRQAAATDWVPMSKPIRFTEYGCAAVDRGTNEPNRFLDPKSSESALPRFSEGRRDDAVQMQYLRAVARHFGDPAQNPVSPLYGSPMVDMARAHAWAWDARPFPTFPGRADLWTDTANYARGHWLNGRATNQALDGVLEEICARSGVIGAVTQGAHGVVRGFAADGVATARSVMQPLMLTYGFDAVERGGDLRFASRAGRRVWAVDPARLVAGEGDVPTVERSRAAEAEVAGRVRLGYIEAEGDFQPRLADAVFPDDALPSVAQSDTGLVLTAAEARATAERWLAEARVARDGARFALPPSRADLGAGDVVALDGGLWRIDRLETGIFAQVEAVRVEPSIAVPSDAAEDRAIPRQVTSPVPVVAQFLDLPLLKGTEVPHAPHLAVSAVPWRGAVAVWSSPDGDGFELNSLVAAPSVLGVTETPLPRARPGVWDRGAPLRVRLGAGLLASVAPGSVLNGANAMAIGPGPGGPWEVFQFAEAVLVGPQTWDLSLRLRGQLGTDAVAPPVWPEGSRVVLLDGGPQQTELPLSARGLLRRYRIGVAERGFDDPDVLVIEEAFDGVGLRPYAPCHLRAARVPGGDAVLTWVRRTRIDGDSWASFEVPLGEEREIYVLRVAVGGDVVRTIETSVPEWTYPAALQAVDGAAGGFAVEVSQVSDRFGAGPFRRIDVPA
ncbi:MAG TPA: glycoside hydrolase/phage tail family protein [Paracoccaceae bacterium]|nr:glycoside hydrolase/phage tail family protein [Paracoccaceae bacterium]